MGVSGGLTLNGIAHLSGSDTAIAFVGTQSFNSGTIAFEGITGVNRQVTIEGTATLTVGAGATIRGGLGTVGGQIFTGGSNALVNQGVISSDVVGQSITVQSASFTNQGTVQNPGGALTIATTVTNSGIFAPGGAGSASVINVTGNFTQTATGTLRVELGGTAVTAFDRLIVTGTTTLAGTLNLALISSFTPAPAANFQFLTYASRTGTFSTIVGGDLGGGRQLLPTYNPTALLITAS